mmetsp:Transcript_72909/g.144926  ORF Transcript_72909/g.144926 Transcript_72909/m.144926 type:complete len:90 (-) Transcript_72909:1683-1952(-)
MHVPQEQSRQILPASFEGTCKLDAVSPLAEYTILVELFSGGQEGACMFTIQISHHTLIGAICELLSLHKFIKLVWCRKHSPGTNDLVQV